MGAFEIYKLAASRLEATISRGRVMANNDLDRLIGSLATPQEIERALHQTAKRALYACRIGNYDRHQARRQIEATLTAVADERGYVRFGANRTIGKLTAKMMAGYEANYNAVQFKLDSYKKKWDRKHGRNYKMRWEEGREEFLKTIWGEGPN